MTVDYTIISDEDLFISNNQEFLIDYLDNIHLLQNAKIKVNVKNNIITYKIYNRHFSEYIEKSEEFNRHKYLLKINFILFFKYKDKIL